MKFTAALVSAALATLAAAQTSTTNNTQVGIEAIEAHFSQSGIVPSLLTTFDPLALMSVTFDGVGEISPGQSLTQTQVAPTPGIAITPANSTVQLSGNFTLVMADAGPVGTDESAGQTRHWLVNSVTVANGTDPLNVSTSSGVAITKYAGPAPAQGSGAHRYVILLFAQPESFTPPSNLSTAGVPVSVFNLNDYVQSTGLGAIVAGTYMTVEEGTASFTPSSTAPVVTSTLPVPKTSGTSSATSGAASPSGSSSGQSSGAGLNTAPLASMLLAGAFALGLVFF
ncbi:hypothetical protein PHLGIDRAFT_117643 [Phlebiopsis gigantea 11061_1 CR5-6]|uniref:PEBP-like protein n=1 Tax=Phlebiopsis gigantea (strain 11061_1 CR5-6) TaxID=745531 RepID=A0A0C3PMT6_PHLG1|nr:hypothetical protein PHLGIDRAFT_117643 [Phlebiopsis gigantea 11061_1 CR5-6]